MPPYSQGHLFEGKTEEGQKKIVEQLNSCSEKLPGGGLEGYLTRARKLLEDAKLERNPFEGQIPKVAEGQKLTGQTGPGSDGYAAFERRGMEQLANTCSCLV